MPKLPLISGKKLLKVFEQYGFQIIRQKGSHVFIKHKITGMSTVIPIHNNEDLGKGLLKSILQDLNLDTDDFLLMLKKKRTATEDVRLDRLSH